ncbi:MAG: hypothetical protein LBD28_06715, partial [Tannerellaceae bacterium]|nr:hypothetical protein [Tannerellaceae bacterium]
MPANVTETFRIQKNTALPSNNSIRPRHPPSPPSQQYSSSKNKAQQKIKIKSLQKYFGGDKTRVVVHEKSCLPKKHSFMASKNCWTPIRSVISV